MKMFASINSSLLLFPLQKPNLSCLISINILLKQKHICISSWDWTKILCEFQSQDLGHWAAGTIVITREAFKIGIWQDQHDIIIIHDIHDRLTQDFSLKGKGVKVSISNATYMAALTWTNHRPSLHIYEHSNIW